MNSFDAFCFTCATTYAFTCVDCLDIFSPRERVLAGCLFLFTVAFWMHG
jgi:hypothetical protein